jgi:hypothetical protein
VNAIAGGVAPTGSFTVGPASGTATVSAPGSSTTYQVTVTGTGGFAGTVDFTCSDPATGVTCSAPTATLSAAATSATSMVSIRTEPATAWLVPQMPGSNGISKYNAPQLAQTPQHLLASTLAMIFAIYAGIFFFMPRNKIRQSTAVFALMVLGLIFVASCGGGSGGGGGTPTGGTPMGNSTVTVTASSGGVTSTTTFTLTVN